MEPSSKFYTKLAPFYTEYASRRSAYLDAVNDFITQEIGSRYYIADVGTGDGLRLQNIIRKIGLKINATLIDDSDGMIAIQKDVQGVKVVKADVSSSEFHLPEKYEAVFCLWNVLGHINGAKNRRTAMKNMADLLEEGSVLFLDVNNRYNAAHYGMKAVFKNLLVDVLRPNKDNGNFGLVVNICGQNIETSVHIFNPWEMERLIKSAGLRIVKRRFIDYRLGKTAKFFWAGQLMYMLKKI
jgi:SAM-dependent methyltransferase